jgi:glycosyltransferase involved in cell wall biosynthesis
MDMRTLFDLLPARIVQALLAPPLLKAITKFRRERTATRNRIRTSIRRVFVDVSVISRHDAGTGIQRVVRALALGLHARPPADWELHFVVAGRETRYHTISWPECREGFVRIEMAGGPGDVFIGLDYSLDDIRWNAAQLARFRRSGGKLWFLVHDLLPLQKPEWFSRNTTIRYRSWLDILARLADGFLCNSTQTRNELRLALKRVYGLDGCYETKVLPMGYRIPKGEQFKATGPGRLDALPSMEYFLKVGTLEPRKGHSDLLDAFDILWASGFPDALVFVGQKGWHIDDLYNRINAHPEYGRKLFWFDDVQDPELDQLYSCCKGSLVASFAEGFGLPLIEALGYQKPVLARDLKVFRQHENCGVQYFPDTHEPTVLAERIKQWSDDIIREKVIVSAPDTGWDESVAELIEAVI